MRPPPRFTAQINVRVTPELAEALQERSEREGVAVNELARRALEAFAWPEPRPEVPGPAPILAPAVVRDVARTKPKPKRR